KASSHAAAAARAGSLELNTSNSAIMRWSKLAAERPIRIVHGRTYVRGGATIIAHRAAPVRTAQPARAALAERDCAGRAGGPRLAHARLGRAPGTGRWSRPTTG